MENEQIETYFLKDKIPPLGHAINILIDKDKPGNCGKCDNEDCEQAEGFVFFYTLDKKIDDLVERYPMARWGLLCGLLCCVGGNDEDGK